MMYSQIHTRIVYLQQTVSNLMALINKVYTGDNEAIHRHDFNWLLEAVTKVTTSVFLSGYDSTLIVSQQCVHPHTWTAFELHVLFIN